METVFLHMKHRSEKSLNELIGMAQDADILDQWGKIGDKVVFRLATVTVDVEEEQAAAFLRGLLRGYEAAQKINNN